MISQLNFTITRTRRISENTVLTEQIKIEGLSTADDAEALNKFGFTEEAKELARTYYPDTVKEIASAKTEEEASSTATVRAIVNKSGHLSTRGRRALSM